MANNIPTTASTNPSSPATQAKSAKHGQPSTKMSSATTATTTRSATSSSGARATPPAIGVFHAPPPTGNAWGTPTPAAAPARGTPAASSAASVTTAKSPSTVARQLFSPSSKSSSHQHHPQQPSQQPVSTTKTTVTYSSPSMAKTKVVATTNPTVSVSDKSGASSRQCRQQQQQQQQPVPGLIRMPVASLVGGPIPAPNSSSTPTPQPLPIKTQPLGPKQGVAIPSSVPTATTSAPGEYSPFNNLYSDLAERVLGNKKDDSADSKMNFASVAAQGVVQPTSNAMPNLSLAPGSTRPPHSPGETDPNLQAKAPGFRAPGQRTSSPQVNEVDHLARAPGYMGNLFMSPMGGSSGSCPPPDVENNILGLRPGIPGLPMQQQQMGDVPSFSKAPGYNPMSHGYGQQPNGGISPRSASSTPLGGQSPRPHDNNSFGIRDEYSTADTPMTLPKIESNLNPDAPDFMSGMAFPRHGMPHHHHSNHNTGGGPLPFHPAFRGMPHPAAAMMNQGVGVSGSSNSQQQQQQQQQQHQQQQSASGFSNLAALSDLSMMQQVLGSFGSFQQGPGAGSGSSQGPGPVGTPQRNRQYSPLANMQQPRSTTSGGSSVTSSSKDGGSPVSGGEMSPATSSSAPSPTERPPATTGPSPHMPRPIGGERASTGQPLQKTSHLGPHGPNVQQPPPAPEPTAGFQAAAADMAASGLWTAYNQDLAAAEWLSQVSSVLTSTVVTSTIVTPDPSTGGMEDTRPRSHPNPIGAGIPGPGSFPVDPGSMDRAIDSSFGTNPSMSSSNSAAAAAALFANGLPPQVAAMFSQAAAVSDSSNMWNPTLAKSLDVGNPQGPAAANTQQNPDSVAAAAAAAKMQMWSNWSNAPGNL